MSGAPFRIAALDKGHDRSVFQCGAEALDLYFRQHVAQDVRRRVTACFVALTREQRIAGYYTLSSASLLLAELPTDMGRKLPRYPTIPAIRMGRLAIDQPYQGQGLGAALLADALERSLRSEIAAYAMVVDAKNDSAAAFYRHHGFTALPDSTLTLFLPLAVVRRLG